MAAEYTFGPVLAITPGAKVPAVGATATLRSEDRTRTLTAYTPDGVPTRLTADAFGYASAGFRADEPRVWVEFPGQDPVLVQAANVPTTAEELQQVADRTAAETEARLSGTYATKTELSEATTGDPITVTDVSMAAVIDDPATETGARFAGKVSKPDAAERVIYVTPRGNDVNDGLTLKTAKATIPAALNALGGAGRIILGYGTFTLTATAALPSSVSIEGAGTGLTTINYTGSGKAFTSDAPGVRSYLWRLSNFTLIGPGNTVAGTVGIDLDSVSTGHFLNLEVRQFEKGFRLYSAQSGYTVYNRFTNCNAQQNATGYAFEGIGANANIFDRCRANLNTVRGVSIVDANNNTFIAPQIESNATGVFIDATSNALADFNMLLDPRFESNTGPAWVVNSANVRDAQIVYPQVFGAYTFTDNGTRTVVWGYAGRTQKATSFTADAAGSWRFDRSVAGGTELPAFVVRDSNTGSGTPVTHQAETERATGFFYRGRRGGVTYFQVRADGVLWTGAGPTTARPSAASTPAGGQWFDTTLGKPIWSTGAAWVDATGATV